MSKLDHERVSTTIIVGAISLALAGCGGDAQTSEANTERSVSSQTSANPANRDYPAIVGGELPDPCAYLTEEQASEGLSAPVSNTSDDPMSCDYFAVEMRKSVDQKPRGMSLSTVAWPRDRFSSNGLNERELREAILSIANHDGLNPQGEYGFGRVYFADKDSETHLIIVPKVEIVRDGSSGPSGELVILAHLRNPQIGMPERLSALRKVADGFAIELRDRANGSAGVGG